MENLLKFMNFGCIDQTLYWRMPSLEGEVNYEIQWRKDHELAWRFRKVGELFWRLSDVENLQKNLEKESLDLKVFEDKVKHSVLQQVSFADRILRDAWENFGRETVEKAVWENQKFMEALEDAVRKLTKPESSGPALAPRQRLTLIKK